MNRVHNVSSNVDFSAVGIDGTLLGFKEHGRFNLGADGEVTIGVVPRDNV